MPPTNLAPIIAISCGAVMFGIHVIWEETSVIRQPENRTGQKNGKKAIRTRLLLTGMATLVGWVAGIIAFHNLIK